MKKYLSLVKFSHTIFAMPFALIGFFLAVQQTGARFNGIKFVLMLACMVFARSAAMAFNRYLDRDIDARNPRTREREIPRGAISARSALIFTALNCLLFLTATWFINPICFYLAPLALLIVLGYSYTKRFTALCHLVLGLGLALAPIGAYLVVTGSFALLPVLFSLAVITWVSGFDIIYALQDEEFDRTQQLHSIPVLLGKRNALVLSKVLHGLSASFVVMAGLTGGFSWLYWVGTFIYCGMLVYQHSLVRPHDLSKVNIAFMTANGIASVVFALFFLADIFLI